LRDDKAIEVSGKPALLVFERRKGTDVVDAMLFVARRSREDHSNSSKGITLADHRHQPASALPWSFG
jgi:hypothetical protein